MLPSTVLVNILGCLKRRHLDALELVDRAFGAVIDTHENHLPRRSLSLIFFNEGAVSIVSFKETIKHVLVVDLPQYLPHSIIRKMLFKSEGARKWTDEMYQALLPCRARLAADAVYDYHPLLVFAPNILRRAFAEIFVCDTLVFPQFEYSALGDRLAALPCLANCSTLQIAYYDEAFFDAKGALEWLLGTHAAAAGVKHLSIGHIDGKYAVDFSSSLIFAIEQQFIHATKPASFTVELRYSVKRSLGPAVGATRELENTVTKEQLLLDVHTSNTFGKKVTVQRKPIA